jgi:hypothetical protein
MSGPVFREDDRFTLRMGSRETEKFLGGRHSNLAARSNAADYYAHDIEGLLQILRFRNRVAEIAQDRNHWFGGRLYNKLSGERIDYIPISGAHLWQALNAAGIEPPETIATLGKYELRLDVSQQAVKNLADLPAHPAS